MDIVHRFSFVDAPIRGQWVRLTDVLAEVSARQPYPEPVRRLLAELLAAVTLIADGIKFQGAVSLQSRGTGPLTTLLAECRQRHLLRGIARWNDAEPITGDASLPALLGDGQLAITLMPAAGSPEPLLRGAPYQGLVAVERGNLAHNLTRYFETSEQLPTRLQLATDQQSVTGLLLQRLPARPGANQFVSDLHGMLWDEVEVAQATLEPAELITLAPAELLTRLFPTRTLTLHPERSLRFSCTCSRRKTTATLAALPRAELLDLLESQGAITVTCEVCGQRYEHDAVDVHTLFEPENPGLH